MGKFCSTIFVHKTTSPTLVLLIYMSKWSMKILKIRKMLGVSKFSTLVTFEHVLYQSATHTYIGDEGRRGVSGGERRRVSIGIDIIHKPSLLFLDEPTSGLDSTSAYSVVEKVKDIARGGSIVLMTIHQPSFRIQLLLDRITVLAR